MDLEKEYSPSLYTKRFQNFAKPEEEVINNFIRVSENGKRKNEKQKEKLKQIICKRESENVYIDF